MKKGAGAAAEPPATPGVAVHPHAPIPTTPIAAVPTADAAMQLNLMHSAALNGYGMASPFAMFNSYAQAMAMQNAMAQLTPQRAVQPALHSGKERYIPDVRSSSPVIDEPISNEEFCALYDLDGTILTALNSLQFTVGDNLSVVTPDEIKAVGLTSLSWARIGKAHRKYMKSARQ